MSQEVIEIDCTDDDDHNDPRHDHKDSSNKQPFLQNAKLPSYFAQAFQDLYQEDGLIVFGRGLGVLLLMAAFCRFYIDVEEGHYSLIRDEIEAEKEKISTPIYDKMNQKLNSKPPLIFVIGLKDYEKASLISILERWGTKPTLLPTEITNESGQGKDRATMYQSGGIFLITSRILIVDLLTNTASSADIDGILVAHAENITEKSTEAFIVRIFRTQKRWLDGGYSENNNASPSKMKSSFAVLPEDNAVLQSLRYGFVKAFTDTPEALISGFSKVNRVLKALFVRKIYLYPRFQADVADDLEHNAPVVEELRQSLTTKMKEIQSSIAVAVQTCIRELKQATSSLDWDDSDLTLENCINNFDMNISRQLEGDWHRLNAKTRQLVNDLRTLRMLFYYLVHYDCISFWKLINSIKTMSASARIPSLWLLTSAADRLFRNAKERIYRIDKHKLDPVLEENPKWRLLHQILTEIEQQYKKDLNDKKKIFDESSSGARVLVMVKDERTLDIVQSYLVEGSQKTMARRWLRYLRNVNDKSRTMARNAGGSSYLAEESRLLLEDEGRVRNLLFGSGNLGKNHGTKGHESKRMQLNKVPNWKQKRQKINEERNRGQVMGSSEDNNANIIDDAVKETEHFDVEVLRKSSDFGEQSDSSLDSDEEDERRLFNAQPVDNLRVIVKTYNSTEGDQAYLLLDDVKPTFIVLFDLDSSFLRHLEIYSSCKENKTHVYFMLFEESSEEKRYINSLSKEQNAFERLIQYKKSMHLPVNLLGPWLSGETDSNEASSCTRAGRGKIKDVKRRDIAVDVREFRSALPSILHQGGMRIAPVTLTIGDFVLSNEHCVERKSISDLFGSFASGRLAKQAEAMIKHYKIPCLLIEFDPDKTFCLQNLNEIGSEIRAVDICSKMALLVQCYPKLRILWSRSPVETLKIFQSLKANHEEVDVKKAVEVGSNESIDALMRNDGNNEEYEINEAARDMLLKLPGITVQNARKIMKECNSIADLASLPREKMREILGPMEGQKLYSFFRKNIV